MSKQSWKGSTLLNPEPPVLVSCGGLDKPNLITIGWTGTICTQPSMVSISVRPERYSHQLLCESGQFAINLPTEKLVRAIDWCGVKSGRDNDKFAACKLHAAPGSVLTDCPILEESPVNLECRVTQVIPLGSHDLFLAEVVACDVDESLLDENGKKIPDPDPDYTGTYRDIQWKNKAITELYYPGSVFKVITAAMGLDSGHATLNTTLNCSGAYTIAKQTYHCAGRKSHGAQNLAEALRNSCNIYFIQLGQRVGSSLFYDYFDAFGFTERTGVDLPNETSFMQYYSKSRLGEVELASSAFGQAMAVTPLQVCTAISAAVNGGYLVTPHVVDKITDQNGNVVQEIGTNIRRQVISESASETIRQIMEFEVGDGTQGGGGNAYVAGYRIGGKSGTSEQLNMDRRADGDYKKVASFAAVLPANDPEILVYVMLDDPNNARTDYSSILAAPVVGNIISEIAPYLGIATDGVDRSGTTVKVPNLTGKEWSNAQVQLNIKGLKHQLAESESDQTAALVTYQYPRAGAEVPYGTTVYLYTDTYEGKHAEVPDVTGKSADFARQMLNAAGLNCTVEGSGTVQSQSEAPGSSVQQGTIVHLICG